MGVNPSHPYRGGYIVNYGANPIILYLCDFGMAGQTGVPAIYLPVILTGLS